jgi:O-antigen/teichoic acid export membrane protein
MSDPAVLSEGQSQGDTIRRNAGFAFLAQLAGAAFTAGLTIFLARRLGAHGFGVFSLALGIAALVLLPSDFGISTSSARFVAEHRGDRSRVASVLADALRLKLLISGAVAALLWALASPIAGAYGIDGLTWPIRGLAVSLFGQSMMMMSTSFVAMARARFQFLTALAESATETAATVALVVAGAGVTGAAFGRAAGYAAGATITIVVLVRIVGADVLPRGLRAGADTRRIATYAGVLLVIDSVYTLFNVVDILIIGAYLSATAVGVFSAPARLMALLAYPGSAIAAGVAPRLARNPRERPNVEAFLVALRVLLIMQAAIVAFVLGWAPLLVKIGLGSGYGESVTVLRVLAPCIFLTGFGPLVSISANYLGEARRRVPIAISAVALNFAIDMLLVPRIGVLGGAVGTDVAYGLYAPAHLVLCQRVLELDLRPMAIGLLRTMIAGAVMTVVLLSIGGSTSEPWRIPLGAIVALSAFAAVLLLTREVVPEEARALVDHVPLLRRLSGVGPGGP